MAHGVGGLNLLSQTLSDHVFLIFCGGIASIANDYQTAVRKKIVCVPVGFTHTHPARLCTASERVCFLVASWKMLTSTSCLPVDFLRLPGTLLV